MEYLNANYELIKVSREHPVCADWIEVPSGMNFAWKDGDSIWFTSLVMGYRDAEIIWQRTSSVDVVDDVNHPTHYASGAVECIEAIEASMSSEAFKGFLKGNVQKYMWRYEQKGGAESLEKAQWYLNLLLSRVGS